MQNNKENQEKSYEKNLEKLRAFMETEDENGITNREKVSRLQKVIRRTDTTDRNKSFEQVEGFEETDGIPCGAVVENGKLIGFGIHIFNEDIYPLQSFEIYLRNCDLTGTLDVSGCEDMLFLDVYHNDISNVIADDMPSMRIFGIQDNHIKELDVSSMKSCQGIDAGMNELKEIDVSNNGELVELYINDNDFTEIDISRNGKLKYFYCHNNRIEKLDTRSNSLLRHLNATGNPMKMILSLAPGREETLPLELYAGDGGTVGLRFNPVYNAQWKETGEWEQCYFAYPCEGYEFDGWYDKEGMLIESDPEWKDIYGASRVIFARFKNQ